MGRKKLGKLELEPIILHQQADQGKTLIDKFETHAADDGCLVWSGTDRDHYVNIRLVE